MNTRRGLLARLRDRRRGAKSAEPDPADPNLTQVVSAFDETEPASSSLRRAASWDPDSPAVLRYHLVVASECAEEVEGLLHADGWAVRRGAEPALDPMVTGARWEESAETLVAERVQRLDAQRCAQHSSRMVGLAQRFGGRALGWEALQNATRR